MTAIRIEDAAKVGSHDTGRPRLRVPPPPPPSQLAGPSSTENDAAALRAFLATALPPVLGLILLVGIWQLATMNGGSIPTPARTWEAAVKLFADPFYRNGPNDVGLGWNILSSLSRVGTGFGIAALIG
ncbi:MAG: nitrate ABC transporter, permease protein, partial [Azovibrio sp.]|nr:nitrate ABC transporter, permease protein [Azovibrio sp.]